MVVGEIHPQSAVFIHPKCPCAPFCQFVSKTLSFRWTAVVQRPLSSPVDGQWFRWTPLGSSSELQHPVFKLLFVFVL